MKKNIIGIILLGFFSFNFKLNNIELKQNYYPDRGTLPRNLPSRSARPPSLPIRSVRPPSLPSRIMLGLIACLATCARPSSV